MRDTFVVSLMEQMRKNDDIHVLTADLGFGVLDRVEAEFPKRLVNVGIAEQNMASIAAGMALEGLSVIAYSIGNFPTLRCLEQLRNDVGYHKADVKVVTVGGGFSYGSLGMSHHATEDISIMRALPNFDVLVPSSLWEVSQSVPSMLSSPGPAYLRLDKSAMPDVGSQQSLELGKARIVRSGKDALIIGAGGVMGEALAAARILEPEGVDVAVFTVPFVEPLDPSDLATHILNYDVVVTVEEGALAGGLGSKILEVLSESDSIPQRFKRLGLPRAYESRVGTQEFLRARHGLDGPSIAHHIRRLVSS